MINHLWTLIAVVTVVAVLMAASSFVPRLPVFQPVALVHRPVPVATSVTDLWVAMEALAEADDEAWRLCDEANETGEENEEFAVRAEANDLARHALGLFVGLLDDDDSVSFAEIKAYAAGRPLPRPGTVERDAALVQRDGRALRPGY